MKERPTVARLQELETRWDKNPSSRAFLPLAEEYRRLGRLEEAEKACREGLQSYPHYHSARVSLGRTLLALDRPKEAAAEFRAVLEAEPQNLLAGRLLAGIYRSQGNWTGALETYRGLQAFYPDDPEVRAQVYQLERGPESESDDSRGDGADGKSDVMATNTLAEIYLRQGLVDRALAVYENMLHADSDNQAVRRRIAEIQGSVSQTPEAATPAPVSAAVAAVPAPSDPRRRVIHELQNWLIGIQKG